MKYYIKRTGRISGPFSGSEIKSGVKAGRLLEQDLVSLSKDGPWRTLKGIFQKVRAAEKTHLLNACAGCGKSMDPKSDVCQNCGECTLLKD
jgi:hypothetical protein